MIVVKNKVLKILEKYLKGELNHYRNDTSCPFSITSLEFVSLVIDIEQEFNIEINDSDLMMENFKTVDDIVKIISKYENYKTKVLKKCLILDCDDVLWKGVSGEEQLILTSFNIKLHQLIFELYNNGVLICLCSKNSIENIQAAFTNLDVSTPISCFCEVKAKNIEKSTQINELIKEINILAESVVFVDNSPYELVEVKYNLPEIEVLQFEENENFFDNLKNIFVSTSRIGDNRTELYKIQKLREKEKLNFNNIDDYNLALETKCLVERVSIEQIPRISELTQRTNQFNLSDEHLTEAELLNYLNDERYSMWFLSVSDSFGDMGIVGSVLLENETSTIKLFCLSCRVFGRGFEDVLLNRIKEKTNNKLKAIFKSNGKNSIAYEYCKKKNIEVIVY